MMVNLIIEVSKPIADRLTLKEVEERLSGIKPTPSLTLENITNCLSAIENPLDQRQKKYFYGPYGIKQNLINLRSAFSSSVVSPASTISSTMAQGVVTARNF